MYDGTEFKCEVQTTTMDGTNVLGRARFRRRKCGEGRFECNAGRRIKLFSAGRLQLRQAELQGRYFSNLDKSWNLARVSRRLFRGDSDDETIPAYASKNFLELIFNGRTKT
jgi:hypothetical protein